MKSQPKTPPKPPVNAREDVELMNRTISNARNGFVALSTTRIKWSHFVGFDLMDQAYGQISTIRRILQNCGKRYVVDIATVAYVDGVASFIANHESASR